MNALTSGERIVRCLTGGDADREVDKAAWMMRRGRCIPGFDRLIPPDASWENFRHAAEEIKKLCYAGGRR